MFTLTIENQITINPNLLESDVSAVPNVRVSDMHNGAKWYSLPPFELLDQAADFNLCFINGRLHSLTISVSNPTQYGESWDDFSETKEHARAKAIEAMLNRLGYKMGRYPWGEIWCGYDAKGGFGRGVVRYTHDIQSFHTKS